MTNKQRKEQEKHLKEQSSILQKSLDFWQEKIVYQMDYLEALEQDEFASGEEMQDATIELSYLMGKLAWDSNLMTEMDGKISYFLSKKNKKNSENFPEEGFWYIVDHIPKVMNLFDHVICEYSLPFPEEVKDLEDPPDWSEFEFQTRSLAFFNGEEDFDGVFDVYNIDEEGQIYKQVLERSLVKGKDGRINVKEVNKGIEKVEFTGEMIFYGNHLDRDYDYWMEFKALFWKGDLKEMSLKDWEKEDNAGRKEQQKKLEDRIKSIQKKNSLILVRAWNKTVELPLFTARYLLSLLIKLCFKLERWLSI